MADWNIISNQEVSHGGRRTDPLPTDYPVMVIADTTRRSIAELPIELQLLIMENIFNQRQIILVDVRFQSGHPTWPLALVNHAPPLQVLASSICRFARFVYEKHWHQDRFFIDHPVELNFYRVPVHRVNFEKDIFHLRIPYGDEFVGRWRSYVRGSPYEGALARVTKLSVAGTGQFASEATVQSHTRHFLEMLTGFRLTLQVHGSGGTGVALAANYVDMAIFLPVTGLDESKPRQIGPVLVKIDQGHPRWVAADDWGNLSHVDTFHQRFPSQYLVDRKRLLTGREAERLEDE
ncbi:hypothetical protein QBC42DRAFT_251300 [Cladorrhinum samala]|uniref:Uncharacterized protein n=1 Tax=Cladorrhinum samala TaxID=585594 RepID=A0AAV9HS60_9PEZI|nr:hypothetical protein QBC42DRAFT_251300 [Cladorrhinum samala]